MKIYNSECYLCGEELGNNSFLNFFGLFSDHANFNKKSYCFYCANIVREININKKIKWRKIYKYLIKK